MIVQDENESRKDYLIRVVIEFIEKHALYETIDYDDTTCDGLCLIDDLEAEL